MPFNQTDDNIFPFEPISLLKAAPLPRGSATGQAVPSSTAPPSNGSVVAAAPRSSWYLWKEARGTQLRCSSCRGVCACWSLFIYCHTSQPRFGEHSPHLPCRTDSAMVEGWAGAAAARGMQGQAQSSAAVAPTPHLSPAGYLALLQLKAVPGWQLSASSPALPGAPGAAWPLASPALPRLLPQTRRLGLPSCITPAGHGGAVKLGPGGRDRALVKSKLPENPVLAQTHPCGL